MSGLLECLLSADLSAVRFPIGKADKADAQASATADKQDAKRTQTGHQSGQEELNMIASEQIDDIITRLESGESRDSIDADLGLSPADRVTQDLVAEVKPCRDAIIQHLIRTRDAESRIRDWLAHIRETDPGVIDEVLGKCAADPEALAYFLGRAAEVPPIKRVAGRTVHGAEVVTEGER